MGQRLFINYRRNDDPGHTGRLYDFLSHRMSRLDIFMDVENGIALGDDFVETLRARVAACSTMFVVIGPQWLRLLATHEESARDFVAYEIALAFELGKQVIPILVGRDARMPDEDSLPLALRPLAQCQAAVLRQETFQNDCMRLLSALRGNELIQSTDSFDTRLEAEAWARVTQTADPAEFRAFLETWPNGAHADAARARLTVRSGTSVARGALRHIIGTCLDGVTVWIALVPYMLIAGAVTVYFQPVPIPDDGEGPGVPEWTIAVGFLVVGAISWWPTQWLTNRFLERRGWVLYLASVLIVLPSSALIYNAIHRLTLAPPNTVPFIMWLCFGMMGVGMGVLFSSAGVLSRRGDV